MDSFAWKVVIAFLVLLQIVKTTPIPLTNSTVLGHEYDDYNYTKRAPPQSPYIVTLTRFAEDTYVGYKPLPGVVGIPVTLSDAQIQKAAQDTFDTWDQAQHYKDQSLLVAVIHIPGYGLAAGTIWHGPDATFENYLQSDAPKLWTLCQRQRVLPGNTASKWHAEIVASWIAEKHFPNAKVGRRWPDGTKIGIWGRETARDNQGKVTGDKPICGTPGVASSNSIPCKRILQGQGI